MWALVLHGTSAPAACRQVGGLRRAPTRPLPGDRSLLGAGGLELSPSTALQVCWGWGPRGLVPPAPELTKFMSECTCLGDRQTLTDTSLC